MKPDSNIVVENMLHAIGNFKEYQNETRKSQMFIAIHSATELMRTTCKLKYARIYTEARSDHHRVKVYQSNYQDMKDKHFHRMIRIMETNLRIAGFKVTVDLSEQNIIFRVYDRK